MLAPTRLSHAGLTLPPDSWPVPEQLLCELPREPAISVENRLRERCSKPCYSLCPRGSASVRSARVISATCRIFAVASS